MVIILLVDVCAPVMVFRKGALDQMIDKLNWMFMGKENLSKKVVEERFDLANEGIIFSMTGNIIDYTFYILDLGVDFNFPKVMDLGETKFNYLTLTVILKVEVNFF